MGILDNEMNFQIGCVGTTIKSQCHEIESDVALFLTQETQFSPGTTATLHRRRL